MRSGRTRRSCVLSKRRAALAGGSELPAMPPDPRARLIVSGPGYHWARAILASAPPYCCRPYQEKQSAQWQNDW